ncbi:MAG: hypothetical protein Q8O74_02225 [bacterium]|nr:hypothetical protein [bacterium]
MSWKKKLLAMAALVAVVMAGCSPNDKIYMKFLKPQVDKYQAEIAKLQDFEAKPYAGPVATVAFYKSHLENLQKIEIEVIRGPKAKTEKMKNIREKFLEALGNGQTSAGLTGAEYQTVLRNLDKGRYTRKTTRAKAVVLASFDWAQKTNEARNHFIQAHTEFVDTARQELRKTISPIGNNKLILEMRKSIK